MKEKKNSNLKRYYTVADTRGRINDPGTFTFSDTDEIISITKNYKRTKKPKFDKLMRMKTSQLVENNINLNDMIERIVVKKQISNYNININYNETPNRRRSFSHSRLDFNSLWKKSLNAVRMSNAFLHLPLERIEDQEIFDDSMKPTVLGLKKSDIIKSPTGQGNSGTDIMSYDQFLRKTPVEKEFIRVKLKEKALKLIEDGPKGQESIIDSFETLFKENPERKRYFPDDKKYLFNQPLPNGKTLLYTACQEGTLDIVKFLLRKGLDPNIKSKYCGMEDTCLSVACRWGYYEVVEALLSTGKIDKDDINEELHKGQCYENIKELLKKQLPNKKKRKGCACF